MKRILCNLNRHAKHWCTISLTNWASEMVSFPLNISPRSTLLFARNRLRLHWFRHLYGDRLLLNLRHDSEWHDNCGSRYFANQRWWVGTDAIRLLIFKTKWIHPFDHILAHSFFSYSIFVLHTANGIVCVAIECAKFIRVIFTFNCSSMKFIPFCSTSICMRNSVEMKWFKFHLFAHRRRNL